MDPNPTFEKHVDPNADPTVGKVMDPDPALLNVSPSVTDIFFPNYAITIFELVILSLSLLRSLFVWFPNYAFAIFTLSTSLAMNVTLSCFIGKICFQRGQKKIL